MFMKIKQEPNFMTDLKKQPKDMRETVNELFTTIHNAHSLDNILHEVNHRVNKDALAFEVSAGGRTIYLDAHKKTVRSSIDFLRIRTKH